MNYHKILKKIIYQLYDTNTYITVYLFKTSRSEKDNKYKNEPNRKSEDTKKKKTTRVITIK